MIASKLMEVTSLNNKEKIEFARKLSTTKPLFAEEFPIIFFWSPKSGCTSLIKWYFYQLGLLEEALTYHPWVHYYRMDNFQKSKTYDIAVMRHLVFRQKETIKLVRDPYTRAVSSFLAAVKHPELLEVEYPKIREGLSFIEFLHKIKRLGVEKGKVNFHIAQQYINDEELYITNYIKLEEFKSEIRKLENLFDLKRAPLDYLVKSHHHITPNVQDGVETPYYNVKLTAASVKNTTLPSYDHFYNKATRQLVTELFKEDFIKYGYNVFNT